MVSSTEKDYTILVGSLTGTTTSGQSGHWSKLAQSAGAVEYTDCTSAEG